MTPLVRAALVRERLDPASVLAILTPPGGATPDAILVGHATDTDPFWSIWIQTADGFRSTSVGSRDGCQMISLLARPAGRC